MDRLLLAAVARDLGASPEVTGTFRPTQACASHAGPNPLGGRAPSPFR
jgi:hypothetical protein